MRINGLWQKDRQKNQELPIRGNVRGNGRQARGAGIGIDFPDWRALNASNSAFACSASWSLKTCTNKTVFSCLSNPTAVLATSPPGDALGTMETPSPSKKLWMSCHSRSTLEYGVFGAR